jgi:hypothetical protein
MLVRKVQIRQAHKMAEAAARFVRDDGSSIMETHA